MKRFVLGFALLCCGTVAFAAPTLNFSEKSENFGMFEDTKPNRASYAYSYRPYPEWKTQASGKAFAMEVAPVLRGMAQGGLRMPAPQTLSASQYQNQAAEFAEVVNSRNEGGRAKIEKMSKDAATMLAQSEATTHVVEVKLSALIDRDFNSMNLTAERVANMAEVVDLDHYHFQIPGSFVASALEEDHIAYKSLDLSRNYLLSVFDLRDYGCAVMKDGIRDYFSKNPDKEKLRNESIYVISRVDFNSSTDMQQAEAYFGRRPAAVITQEAIYADHLVRGAKTVFAFYPEGAKTRVVLLSNIAMGSKFFTGVKGTLIRQYLLSGIGGGATGAALKAKDALTDLIAGASSDVADKNSCDRGLALGLIKYSQGLFQEFVNFTNEK
ncbi:MAG: hypothetical protein KF767_14650 [Bdellovibrionaceae bacterium]|nr:hypothetical protein [Pseudobdellovibrionaceae bacterium]